MFLSPHSNTLGTEKLLSSYSWLKHPWFMSDTTLIAGTGSGFALIAVWCFISLSLTPAGTQIIVQESKFYHGKRLWIIHYTALNGYIMLSSCLRPCIGFFFSDQRIHVEFYLNAVLSNRVGLWRGRHHALLATFSCFQSVYAISAQCQRYREMFWECSC